MNAGETCHYSRLDRFGCLKILHTMLEGRAVDTGGQYGGSATFGMVMAFRSGVWYEVYGHTHLCYRVNVVSIDYRTRRQRTDWMPSCL